MTNSTNNARVHDSIRRVGTPPVTSLRRGVAVEVVQHLLGHASMSTTIDTYSHLGIEDARRALVAAGVLAEVNS